MTQNMFENPKYGPNSYLFNSLMLETDKRNAYSVPISSRQDMSPGTLYLLCDLAYLILQLDQIFETTKLWRKLLHCLVINMSPSQCS